VTRLRGSLSAVLLAILLGASACSNHEPFTPSTEVTTTTTPPGTAATTHP
jgi:ABC-type glycerol-3-phosphate transport system substrate-binding protein